MILPPKIWLPRMDLATLLQVRGVVGSLGERPVRPDADRACQPFLGASRITTLIRA